MRDFGPISSASIALRPLTVFIGANNSGKSYAARLLHSLLAAQSRFPTSAMDNGDALDACRNIVAGARRGGGVAAVSLDADDSRSMDRVLLERAFCSEVRRNMERNFGSPLGDLVRTGRTQATVTVLGGGMPDLSALKFTMDRRGGLEAEARFRGGGHRIEMVRASGLWDVRFVDKDAHPGLGGKGAAGGKPPHYELAPRSGPTGGRGGPDFPPEADIVNAVALHLQRGAAQGPSIYLPAARSTIMETYRALAAAMVEDAPGAAPGRNGGLGVPGVIADIVAGIIRLDGSCKGPFFNLAARMEREMMSGSIELSADPPGRLPAVLYSSAGRRMPMPQASSSVSEIAPLSLYLKHAIAPGSAVVVEEPEAHLHPASVVILAKYIVRLVRRGVHILLTTHSAYLLEKISKYMMASSLPPKDRAEGLGYRRDDYLAQDEVSAYLFKRARGGGYRAAEVSKDDEEYGISQEEFIKVDQALHRENVIMYYRGEGK